MQIKKLLYIIPIIILLEYLHPLLSYACCSTEYSGNGYNHHAVGNCYGTGGCVNNSNGYRCGGPEGANSTQSDPSGDDNLGKPDCEESVGHPVNVTTGNVYYSHKDFDAISSLGAPMSFVRSYNSQSWVSSSLGYGWTDNFNIYLSSTDCSGSEPDGTRMVSVGSSGSSVNGSGYAEYSSIQSGGYCTGLSLHLGDGREVLFSIDIWTASDYYPFHEYTDLSGAHFTAYAFDYKPTNSVTIVARFIIITSPTGVVYVFDTFEDGNQVSAIIYPNGSELTFHYIEINIGGGDISGGTNPPIIVNVLSEVDDNSGHSIQFFYTNGLLTTVIDPEGNHYQYSYSPSYTGGLEQLLSVTYQRTGYVLYYEYNGQSDNNWSGEGLDPTNLVKVSDSDGNTFNQYTYDPFDRATSASIGNGSEENLYFEYYTPDPNTVGNVSANTYDGASCNGQPCTEVSETEAGTTLITYYIFGTINTTGTNSILEFFGERSYVQEIINGNYSCLSDSCNGVSSQTSFQYDNNMNLVQITKPGETTNFSEYNTAGQPGLIQEAAGTSDERDTHITYNSTFQWLPISITMKDSQNENRAIDYTYTPIAVDFTTVSFLNGNVNTPQVYNYSITIPELSNIIRIGYTPTDWIGEELQIYSTRLGYNTNGQLSQVVSVGNGFSTPIMSLQYDSTNKNLQEIDDALSNPVLQIQSYDAYGHPNQIVDSTNGRVINIIYNSLGEPTIVVEKFPNNINSAWTFYTYSNDGRLLSVVTPKGAMITYKYLQGTDWISDIQRYITTSAELAGTPESTIHYDRDPQFGFVTHETISDQNGYRDYDVRYIYNFTANPKSVQIEWLYPQPHSVYAYFDDNGNLSALANSENQVILHYTRDPLNRITKIDRYGTSGAAGNSENFTYNIMNMVTSITDSLGSKSKYSYDDFNRLIGYASRNFTGTGSYQIIYDQYDNPIEMRDPNGVITNWSYSQQNQVVKTFSNSPTSVQWNYESPLFIPGRGRISEIIYGNPNYISSTRTYSYDARGNVSQIQDGPGVTSSAGCMVMSTGETFTSQFQYDPDNNLESITYPVSGRTVTYYYSVDPDLVSGISTNVNGVATTLVNNITRLPYGPITGWSDNNGVTTSLSYDQSYMPEGLLINGPNGAIVDKQYTYDNDMAHITHIADQLSSFSSETFSYDQFNKLISAVGPYGSLTFTYNTVGDMLDANNQSTGQTDVYNYITGTDLLYFFADPLKDKKQDAMELLQARYERVLSDAQRILEHMEALQHSRQGDNNDEEYRHDGDRDDDHDRDRDNDTAALQNRINQDTNKLTADLNVLLGDPYFDKTTFISLVTNDSKITNIILGMLSGGGISSLASMTPTTIEESEKLIKVLRRINLVKNMGHFDPAITYDANGNMTYDGLYYYTYDALNNMTGIGISPNTIQTTYGYDPYGQLITTGLGSFFYNTYGTRLSSNEQIGCQYMGQDYVYLGGVPVAGIAFSSNVTNATGCAPCSSSSGSCAPNFNIGSPGCGNSSCDTVNTGYTPRRSYPPTSFSLWSYLLGNITYAMIWVSPFLVLGISYVLRRKKIKHNIKWSVIGISFVVFGLVIAGITISGHSTTNQDTPIFYNTDQRGALILATNASGASAWQASYYQPYGAAMTSGPIVDMRLMGMIVDPSGLYYNMARWYNPTMRMYLSEDPMQATYPAVMRGVQGTFPDNLPFPQTSYADMIQQAALNIPYDPSSMLAYGYVGDDPINFVDPWGQDGFGIIVGGSTEAGVGPAGAVSTASAGVGPFWGGPQGTNIGGFYTKGGFIGGPGYGISYPIGNNPNTVSGAYGGGGIGGYITNAKCASQLAGPFITTTFNVGIPDLPGVSVQYSEDAKGTWIWSVTFGPGAGLSSGVYQTTTRSTK